MTASTAATAGSEDFVEELYEAVYYSAQKIGVSTVQADDLARQVEHELRSRLGTARVYIPAPDVSERNRRIAADLESGMSVQQVQQRYGVSRSLIYRVRSQSGS